MPCVGGYGTGFSRSNVHCAASGVASGFGASFRATWRLADRETVSCYMDDPAPERSGSSGRARIDQAARGSNDMVTRTVPFGRTYQSDGSRSRSPARRPVVARAAVARAGGTPQPRRRRGIIGELLDYSDEVRRARDAVALVTGTLPPRRRRSIIGQLIDYHREVIRLNELVQQLGSRAAILVPDLPPSTLVTPRVTVATQTEPGVWSPISGIQLGVVADAPSSDEDAEPLSIEELRSFVLRYYELHPEMETMRQ